MERDFGAHNEEVKLIWEAFQAGKPVRVPMIIGCNVRALLLDPKLNKKKITFKEYSENPDLMLEKQMEFQKWYRTSILQDAVMGVPAEGFNIDVDLQNYFEAAWFGCEINYREGQVPDTAPVLSGDRKNYLFDRGIPAPFSGLMEKNLRYYEYFKQKQKDNYRFEGIPVNSVRLSGMYTDGVMTGAINLRGMEFLTDFYEDPDYVRKLFAYINRSTNARIKAFRKYLKEPEKSRGLFFADDSIALISTEMYREFVLPFHKELIAELSDGDSNSIHLCGDATRHFKLIRDELKVRQFDTGFPVDFGGLRKELGEGVTVYGGPNINLLLLKGAEEVSRETKRILQSGIMEGGKFVIREGNNLAPATPQSNIKAMYDTVREFGKFPFSL